MTDHQQRVMIVGYVDEAVAAGARRTECCKVIGISLRTLQRWRPGDTVLSDRRPMAQRPTPANKLSEAERKEVLAVINAPEFANDPPTQIVPKLADQGRYVASESTMYRLMEAEGLKQHRGRAARPKPKRPPQTHVADGPNQVWTWDITWLPSTVRGRYFYLYMVMDLYSRYGVMWEVHSRESGELAAELLEKAVWREHLTNLHLVLHSDNGAPMKSLTLRAKLDELGVTPSYSRPRVSNDNPFSEAMFRTVKYCPAWPPQGFETIEEARRWVAAFMQWYHHEHRHSGLRFITPAQRHFGEDTSILEARRRVYKAARSKNPERWSRDIRDWSPVGSVALNPLDDMRQQPRFVA